MAARYGSKMSASYTHITYCADLTINSVWMLHSKSVLGRLGQCSRGCCLSPPAGMPANIEVVQALYVCHMLSTACVAV
jgi:hypothetical protein